MKRLNNNVALAILVASLFVFSSCSRSLGYGVLLWNAPQYRLCDGDVLKVLIKSNISGVYVVELPTVEGSDSKVEIPLWQMSVPQSKKAALEYADKISNYSLTYARVLLDGLPIRRDSDSTARQIYRLRKGEVVKVLFAGPKGTVSVHNKPVEGSWLNVLTQDGTQGWCFSLNLHLFKTDRFGQSLEKEESAPKDDPGDYIALVLSKVWYPENFQTIIDSRVIDTQKLHADHNLHLDSSNKMLTLRMESALNGGVIDEAWHYSGAKKIGTGEYKVNGVGLIVRPKRSDHIVISYTNESGKPEDISLVTLSTDIDAVIKKELSRRHAMLLRVIDASSVFKSANYGTLTFDDDYYTNGSGDQGEKQVKFAWRNKKLLNNSVLRGSSRDTGTVCVKYLLAKSLQNTFDGVLTFDFDGAKTEVNFLYKLEENGLRLEDATLATYKSNTLTSRSTAPLVLFFSK